MPAAVVTVIGPVVAPEGTVVTMRPDVSLVTVAVVPLNITVALDRFVPLIATVVPTAPLVGLKLVIVGAGTIVNEEVLVAVPADVVTVMVPVVAPAGTVAVIEVAEPTE